MHVAIGFIGTTLDYVGTKANRWDRWRPTVSLCSQDDLIIDEFHLLGVPKSNRLAGQLVEDIASVSPETRVTVHPVDLADPWDFEEVYSALFDFVRRIDFDTENNDYLMHITTGTHVAQICMFLLTESHHFPGRLIQTSPGPRERASVGKVQIIDLNLARYDQIASRFAAERLRGTDFLKAGIATRNTRFNEMIDQIERVAVRSTAPILLMGPTGAGKTQLATRIFDLKRRRQDITGDMVSVNCATLRGDGAMSALFGHVKGAYTGAQSERTGFLRRADHGLLFLDEIGELGSDEQAMLLHALETGTFFPVGSDRSVESRFQLLAGTNRDLAKAVHEGKFRDDLLARINLWTYRLPGLAERREDIEPNIDYELDQFARSSGTKIDFNREARTAYVAFALSEQAQWRGNFRDLNASIVRMATLADGARITRDDVEVELSRLREPEADQLPKALPADLGERWEALDRFDQAQLLYVMEACRKHPSMAAAGRHLFNVSREEKASVNDSARLQKYLKRFGLRWSDLSGG